MAGMVSERRTVSFQQALEWCNGQTVTHKGISGVVELVGKPPYQKVYHRADVEGRASKAYIETREQLRDDWCSDLTEDCSALCEHMAALGVETTCDAVTMKTIITVPVSQ